MIFKFPSFFSFSRSFTRLTMKLVSTMCRILANEISRYGYGVAEDAANAGWESKPS
jgi:hypothetical protein